MSPLLRSFRLNDQAAHQLSQLADQYGISPNSIINLLLTEIEPEPHLMDQSAAAHILENYFTKKLHNPAHTDNS